MMRFRLLGPLEVWAGEDWQGIGAPKWRSVLAALLISGGRIVPVDVLINEVWGETPPAKAGNLISIYVLRLRRLLGDTDSTLLVTRAPGYLLRLAPGDTDAQVFETLLREGGRAYATGDPERAAPDGHGGAVHGAQNARSPSGVGAAGSGPGSGWGGRDRPKGQDRPGPPAPRGVPGA